MKAYLLNLLTPSVFMKKLGIIGLIIIIPLLVLRLVVAVIFGSWTDMLISIGMILTLLLGWDILNFEANQIPEKKTVKVTKDKVQPKAKVQEEFDIEGLMKEKGIKS